MIIYNGPDHIPDFDIGTTATYWCDSGFSLVGGIFPRVCGEDGVFSGEAPVCQRKDPVNVLHAFSQSSGIS